MKRLLLPTALLVPAGCNQTFGPETLTQASL